MDRRANSYFEVKNGSSSEYMIDFSVLITSYNRPDLCQRAVLSAKRQNILGAEVEIVVVNDGSNELYDVDWFLNEGCSYHHIDNVGMCAARNFGVEQCRNNWVALLDDDDFWREDHLSVLAEAIERGDNQIGFYYCEVWDWFGDVTSERRPFSLRVDGISDLDYIFSGGYRLPSATCYSRQVLLDIPFSGNDRFSEDIWHSALILKNYSCVSINTPTVYYNNVSIGATKGDDLRTYKAAIKFYQEILSHEDFKTVRSHVLKGKLGWWYFFGIQHLSGEFSRSEYLKASKGLLLHNRSYGRLDREIMRLVTNTFKIFQMSASFLSR